jgi:hypothetical protein
MLQRRGTFFFALTQESGRKLAMDAVWGVGQTHFFPALTFAHRARAAALIRASPAAEM